MPTGYTKVSSRSLTLSSAAATLHVDTKFPAVEQMVRAAFELFVDDLQLLEANGRPEADAGDRSGRGSTGAAAAAAATPKKCEKDEATIELEEQLRVQEKALLQQRQRDCDIKRFNVRIAVSTIPDVHLSLDMDESYNLTVTSE